MPASDGTAPGPPESPQESPENAPRAASAPLEGLSLLDRRLVIVTGKGGTGKTTVAAALAVAAAGAGRRVAIVEMAHTSQIQRLLDPGSPPLDYAGRTLVPRIHALRVDPFEALAEYLGLQLGVRAPVDLVLRNKGFRQLMNASPGWRELITLGKVWHLEQMRDGARPLYDLIVVDAPATGHGLTFLDVPRVVVSAVRAGPLRHHTERVEALISDPGRTLLLPVALAEELPARETLELLARVRNELSVHVDRVVVNGVNPAPFPAGLEDLDERLAGLPAAEAIAGLPPFGVLARCASHQRSRHELNRRHLDAIARESALPVSTLPYLREGVQGPDDLALLAAALVPGAEARAT